MSNTVHGPTGTDFEVRVAATDAILLSSIPTSSGLSPWVGTLTIENSQHLRLLLAEAEIEARPLPTKAERIREVLRNVREYKRSGVSDRGLLSSQKFRIEKILDEDGPL